ncbi:hypothetical protein SCLCIDRAFT_108122 [Scleroderma citrinum Foug A]|uniref:DUF6532 domain-containing protein n=1 Tax=Scleroderma citrinum Foug A TaxID=1036808 RepID=A0A0C3AR08_9AGAM|nr:hypothetical protein SCLCIDRAFT_108122 [Scleroderma citrinum Foug A]
MPNSKSDPSHLQHYTPPVHDIIEHAKQISHCDIAAVNSFPLCADFNCKAVEYVNVAITKCHLRDLSNWCSALKKKAHMYVCEHYKWDPQNCCQVNANIARELLEHGNFLKHGVDEEGHTNSLVHLTLSGLVINFFYTGTNAMVSLFLEVFGNEVPCAAIALGATAIKVALDEVVTEGKEVTFKHDVYVDLLGLM